MIMTISFVVSFTCAVFFIVTLFEKNLPIPILHLGGYNFGNTYIFTPSIMFQVWFWFTHFNII